jgi:glycosyltransferase involved in cell wall biosynthesis
MKKPVICTSFYEVKKTGKNIVQFADTKEQFYEAIKKLKNDKLRVAVGEKGLNEVVKYDWQRLSSQYYDIIDSL